MKKILMISTIMVAMIYMVLCSSSTSYAAQMNNTVLTNQVTKNANVKKWKCKNKIIKNGKTEVAKFTINYSTKMQGGRTVFDEVGIELHFYNGYKGTYLCTEATGDVVKYTVYYNKYGLISGSQTVSFMP